MKGTVFAFEPARGVGLVTPETGGACVGFRIEDVDVPKGMSVGEPVVFTVEVGDWYANRIRLLNAPRATRSRRVAAGLAILGGAVGMQKFYMGYPGVGLILLLGTLLFWWLAIPVMAAAGLGLIEGVIYLTLSDKAFEQRYLKGRRRWL